MKEDIIDTTEAGGGSYPSPDEEERCFVFDFEASTRGYGIVYARTQEEAEAKVREGDYDDIIETYGLQIEDVTKIEEE